MANEDLKARNEPINRFVRIEFEAIKEMYRERVKVGGLKRKGKALTLKVYLKNNRITRGDHIKEGGVN